MYNMKQIIKLLLWAAVVAVMVIIFSFSTQPAKQSNDVSEGVTRIIVDSNPNTKDLPEQEKENIVIDYNKIIRKYAHFTLFLLLGLLSALAFMITFNKTWDVKIWLATLVFCLAYAISDEVHQIFVDGRGAEIKDVLTDFSGSFIGSLAVLIIKKIKSK